MPVPHILEHFTIFLMTGLAFGVGYPSHRVAYAIVSIAFAAGLEIGQIWDPGRHARFSDFVVNLLGLWLGLLLTIILSGVTDGSDHSGAAK